MHLEGIWPVYRKDKEVGQCRFQRQGLYWLVDGQCTGQGALVCRLWLISKGLAFNLGIPVPEGDGLRLLRRIAIKGLTVPGAFRLELKPLTEPGVMSRDALSPGHASAEPEIARREEVPPMRPDVSITEESPTRQQTPSEDSAPARQPESATTEEATGATAENATGTATETTNEPTAGSTPGTMDEPTAGSTAGTATMPTDETANETAAAEPAGIPPDESATPEIPTETKPAPEEIQPDEAVSHAPTPEEAAGNLTPDEPTATNEPATEAPTTAQNSPEPPETAGIPYDPQKPLPPLGNWENLRAVSDGHGGLLICTAGEDKAQ